MSGASIYGVAVGWPQATFAIKQGATLQLLIAVTNDDNTVFDLTGVTVTAQLRQPDVVSLVAPLAPPATPGVVIDLAVISTTIAGQLSITQATDLWAPGRYVADFKFVQGAIVQKSDTFALIVEPAVTA
jgi:hypothetical protein